MTTSKKLFALVAFISVCLLVGGSGAWATNPQLQTWYPTIAKPSWNPPNWIFGPMWTTLYILMGIAAWVIWQKGGFRAAAWPLSCFAIQLFLNGIWSWIFFGYHQIGWALVDIVFLWIAIGVTTFLFFRRSTLAGGLLLPYWAWVSFATVLNYAIWKLNSP